MGQARPHSTETDRRYLPNWFKARGGGLAPGGPDDFGAGAPHPRPGRVPEPRGPFLRLRHAVPAELFAGICNIGEAEGRLRGA